MAQVKLGQLKQQIQKYMVLKKQTQRNAAIASAALKKRKTMTDGERSSTRVKDMVASLSLLADKRRDQLNQKRTSSTSSTWVQNLPGVPGPLRRSLWHKMHRRRQQIVLRPSQESLAVDLKSSILKSLANIESLKDLSEASKTVELQKAEQAFLLAVHPVAPQHFELPSVPSTSSWGEPGKSISSCRFPEHRSSSLVIRLASCSRRAENKWHFLATSSCWSFSCREEPCRDPFCTWETSSISYQNDTLEIFGCSPFCDCHSN